MFSANSSQVSDEKLYVEDVFSTYLYTGTGAAQTITNNIDLAGKGGMVWIKSRSAATNNFLFDTSRGVNVEINSNTTDANATLANSLTAFNSNGFSISSATGIGVNAATYASWTFRKAPKFFDVVTYTGNGVFGRAISHNLGVAPGCILVKCLDDGTLSWRVYHRSLAIPNSLILNSTASQASDSGYFTNTAPTSTEFYVGDSSWVNGNTKTYVAYLFAHDATSDGIIQCGSFTTDASRNYSINLGWEPQWILTKPVSTTGNWQIYDTMRQWDADQKALQLVPNTSAAEFGPVNTGAPTATGVLKTGGGTAEIASQTYIYIAIRRGPMRTPTSGTSVFKPDYMWGTSSSIQGYLGAPADLNFAGYLTGSASNARVRSRLVGSNYMATSSSAAETADSGNYWDNMLGFSQTSGSINTSLIEYTFRRAPSFLDVVCYTGTGTTTTFNHNLGVVPELMIVKRRSGTYDWVVYSSALGATQNLYLNRNDAQTSAGSVFWNSTDPTSSVFTVGSSSATNGSGQTHVAYLFASCPGVSKVGSYTGNGSSQTINCGFAAGARFVLIKRTDSTGNWLVADSARGIVAGNDPLLYLNSTAAEVTSLDWIDADSSGFVVNQDSTANANVNGATYIYLAVA